MSVVIGLDCGLATFGWAAVELNDTGERVLGIGTWQTKKSEQKRGVRVADDDVRRIRSIASKLNWLIKNQRPVALCAELPGGSKGARAAQALGIGKAIVACVAELYGLPLAACSPQQLKKALTGKASATKREVQERLAERYGGLERLFRAEHNDYRGKKLANANGIDWSYDAAEHAGDALGAVVACLDSDVILMARRLVA